MQARSAVIDLYGDHLAVYEYWAPIAAVVALTGTCGVAPPATRTAVSRLRTQDWLAPRPQEGVRGYVATRLARRRLRHARERIYAPAPRAWREQWHVVVVETPAARTARDRLTASLGYLGYGRLAPATWVSPHANDELGAALEALGVGWTEFTGPSREDPVSLVSRVWDLADLAQAYRAFVADAPAAAQARSLPPEQAYPVRTELVHRWRKFMFTDPGLPREVLPTSWPGHPAREQFLEVAAALLPPARTFVGAALAQAGATGHPAVEEDA